MNRFNKIRNVFFLLLALSFFSCKKDKPKQYSYWKVDGREYSSNNTQVTIGKAIGLLSCRDKERFKITFYTFSSAYANSLPDAGNYLLAHDNIEQSPRKVLLDIFLGTTMYAPSINETKYLKAERVNGKVRYTLPPMWYVNYYNPDDSVFVEGTFNEP